MDGSQRDTKFTKSRTNSATEKLGLSVLLTDPRFQAVNLACKQRILELILEAGHGEGLFGHQTFDAVMLAEPGPR